MVLGVDGGPCAPESTTKFDATCEYYKFKDIADVAPLCGTKIESLENDVQWRIDLRKNSKKFHQIEIQLNSTTI